VLKERPLKSSLSRPVGYFRAGEKPPREVFNTHKSDLPLLTQVNKEEVSYEIGANGQRKKFYFNEEESVDIEELIEQHMKLKQTPQAPNGSKHQKGS
jgi:hypothetical protein